MQMIARSQWPTHIISFSSVTHTECLAGFTNTVFRDATSSFSQHINVPSSTALVLPNNCPAQLLKSAYALVSPCKPDPSAELYSHPPPGLWLILSVPSRDGTRTYANYIHALLPLLVCSLAAECMNSSTLHRPCSGYTSSLACCST